MKDPSTNIAVVLKKVRFERGLTLEDTSNLTGVSKAMLGQIERGESNPTISTLWKISTGLRISFSELLSSETNDYEPISLDDLEPVYESDGKMMLYDVFPFNPISGFEYFYIKLLPGANHVSTPHENSINEYIIVTKGTLVLTVDKERFELKAPSALAFKANVEHSYSNPYDIEVIFQNIVKY
ncbi:helix-turn-helix domain-containing protein [Tissierella praeacuta]|uniref:Transcriptional regulator, XRE family with cupin sensor n=1 Tax=Tissierella praeacuta DSM 18095 TaxID=1123404 RepID=A0A1M4TVL3_9FIRM|nr:XRE family transcriptional regulator [Tissierella praeacuta]HAE92892.1 XRE family transcriptional regulator [Tissierella sp.]MBU5255877.1 XRE family transcriptional regulator [Tissierella praeacuta]TCU77320.1 XRE family transcriptional regulator [Tissierella praeacuta]SHE48337.1 transcriptional regulator, XRE family with cupin sensor [Tissierella praeacuta DSM 18095]SUP04265.1 HTH-type transcriptional regulator PuuR [Tissierella praeacuta]